MIFEIVARHRRWLAWIPLAPHLFDALLLAWTAFFHPRRITAMEAIEAGALEFPGVRPTRHRFGGVGFVRDKREFAHIHGNGLLDVRLGRKQAEALVATGRARTHHVFGPSAWVSFWIRSEADLPDAIYLVSLGANRAPRGSQQLGEDSI